MYLNEYFRVLVNAEGIVNSVESTLEKNCPIHKWKVFGKLGNLKADMFEECPISDILRFQYLFKPRTTRISNFSSPWFGV